MDDLMVEYRKLFAKVLKDEFAVYKQGEPSPQLYFVAALAEEKPAFWDVRNVPDSSLDAVWNFLDTFGDALNHRHFIHTISGKSGKELTFANCEKLIEHIIKRFEQGLDITEPDILDFRGLTKR